MGDWIKSRGSSGEYGYLNLKTGEFRTTLSDLEQLTKRNLAALTTHSANKARFQLSGADRVRNHGSERIRKTVDIPVLTYNNGEANASKISTIAPFEDSVGGVDPLALFYVEAVALSPAFKLAGRGAEYGLARAGNNWARSRIISRNLNTTVNNGLLQNAGKLLEGYWLDQLLNFGKNSGKLIHGDSGDKVGMFRKRGQGAIVKDGKLYPGKGLLEVDYSWWNLNKPYLESHLRTSDNPVMPIPTRWVVVDESEKFINPGISDLVIGLSNKGKGLILKTERVSDTPVDLSNALVLLRDPLLQTWNRVIYQGERPIEVSKPYVRWSLKPEKLAKSLITPTKNPNNYTNVPIIGSNLTGTTRNLGLYKFNIQGQTFVDGLNLDLGIHEMPRRLRALGYDLSEEKVAHLQNGKISKYSAELWLEDNLARPNYIGNFNKRGIGGLYNYTTRDAYIAAGKNADTGLYHERVMHGTDDLIDNLRPVKGKVSPRLMYQDFVNDALSKGTVVDTPKGKVIEYNGSRYPIGSKKWKELRATVGEILRSIYDAINRSKGGKSSVQLMRNEFEAVVDRIDDLTLLDILLGTNSYGNTYVKIGSDIPEFVSRFKHLLKYAPVSTVALAPLRIVKNYDN